MIQNEKVKELSSKISETRAGVTGVKATIDGMRTTRDTQLSQMSSKLCFIILNLNPEWFPKLPH